MPQIDDIKFNLNPPTYDFINKIDTISHTESEIKFFKFYQDNKIYNYKINIISNEKSIDPESNVVAKKKSKPNQTVASESSHSMSHHSKFLLPSELILKNVPVDSAGYPIGLQAYSFDSRTSAAKIIQTWWRQNYRARTIHPQIGIKGHTLRNYVVLNEIYFDFHFLFHVKLPDLITTIVHSSHYLSCILHDGIIYPSATPFSLSSIVKEYPSSLFTAHEGMIETIDTQRQDRRMVFTAPFYKGYPGDKITLNLEHLIKANQAGKGIYFKFFDWYYNKTLQSQLTPKFWIGLNYNFNHTTARLMCASDKSIIEEVSIPSQWLVYHGHHGLNRYLTLFLFKIINLFKTDEVKEHIRCYFSILRDNGTLISHLQKVMVDLLRYCELDFVHPVILNLGSMINCVINKINYTRNDIIRLSNSSSNLEVAGIIKSSFFILNELSQPSAFVMQVKEQQRLFNALTYVSWRFLNKPYSEPDVCRMDLKLATKKGLIFRPNHGLIHSLRVAFYIDFIIYYGAQQTHHNLFQKLCLQLLQPENLSVITNLKIALLFSVSGRASEASFSDNKDAYARYKKASAHHFEHYTSDNRWHISLINILSSIILNLGNPNFKPQNEFVSYLYEIMNLSHVLDLMRCKNKNEFRFCLKEIQNSALFNFDDLAFKELLAIASDCIAISDDRLLCFYNADQRKLQNTSKAYGVNFITLSNHPSKAFALLQSLKTIEEKRKKFQDRVSLFRGKFFNDINSDQKSDNLNFLAIEKPK